MVLKPPPKLPKDATAAQASGFYGRTESLFRRSRKRSSSTRERSEETKEALKEREKDLGKAKILNNYKQSNKV